MQDGRGLRLDCSIAPWLSVRDAARAVEFYISAFGATVLFQIDGGEKGIVARLGLGDSAFWVSDEAPSFANFSPETLGGSTARMMLTVPDPDAAFTRAVMSGATEIHAVEDMHGWRVGRLVDPFGHHWEIGREL